jgi:hypothetical protein
MIIEIIIQYVKLKDPPEELAECSALPISEELFEKSRSSNCELMVLFILSDNLVTEFNY